MEASALHAPSGLGRITTHGPLLRLRSDDQLVALFRMGYDDAFRTIHDRYRQRLFAYTRQMLAGSRSDAEDVLQDVFLRAYGALRNDDRPVTLRAWLYRVAHNRCIDQLRRPVPPAAEVYQLTRTPLRDPLDETERREDLRDLVKDVQRLPEQQRSALLMRELDGLSYAELADALRTSVPAIKSLLVRARIGLVEAGEARDTACAEIRDELVQAHGRGVRASARSRRHMRDCTGCRDYRRALRSAEHGFAALSPTGGSGPLATLAKLLGLGGASSGAAAGATAGLSGSAAVVGGATATKVAAIVCCAAVVGGGAVEVREHAATKRTEHHATARKAKPVVAKSASAAPSARVMPPVARAADPARGHEAPVVAPERKPAAQRKAKKDAAPSTTSFKPKTTPAVTPTTPATPEEAQTGGAMAPDESTLPDPSATGGNGAPPETTPAATTPQPPGTPAPDPTQQTPPPAAEQVPPPPPPMAGGVPPTG